MPWEVSRVEATSATLDLSSSGQAPRTVTRILFEDELFANVAEETCWHADRFQVTICEACAIEHCESGGWLQLRAVGEALVFQPCFDDYLSEDSWAASEYAPPAGGRPWGSVLRARACCQRSHPPRAWARRFRLGARSEV